VTPLRIRYRHCDPVMSLPGSFISLLVAEASGGPVEVVPDPRVRVDLQLTSVQIPLARKLASEGRRLAATRLSGRRSGTDPRWDRDNPEPEGDARAHMWITGENVRPPVGPWDGYLSFDIDPLEGLNAYLPLWWYSIGLLGRPTSIFTSDTPSWKQLVHARNPGSPRDKFACAFINNPEPMRLHAVKALEEIGQVDVYGGAVGRPVPDKAAVAGDYRFVLCFENDIYPGYVTEKPFEAWATGAVPLWRGMDPAGYINPAAMINAAESESLQDFAEAVAVVEAQYDHWCSIASQPILTRKPDLEPAVTLIRGLLGTK
jgi:hypothetical protein